MLDALVARHAVNVLVGLVITIASLAACRGVANSRVVLRFFSEDLEQMLLNLESEYQGRDPSQIRTTQFAIRRLDDRYEFFVTAQTPL
jgi:hypothetical protein